MAGVVEKSDLLRLAKSRIQLWECRRINLCGVLMATSQLPLVQLQAAMAVFRVASGVGSDLVALVKGVKDTLKRTYGRCGGGERAVVRACRSALQSVFGLPLL